MKEAKSVALYFYHKKWFSDEGRKKQRMYLVT